METLKIERTETSGGERAMATLADLRETQKTHGEKEEEGNLEN